MSRTYRTHLVAVCEQCDKPYWNTETLRFGENTCDCEGVGSWGKSSLGIKRKPMKTRDGKQWFKPPHWFKEMRSRRQRAQAKQALHNHVYKGKDYIPPVMNRNSDQWNWT